MTVSARPVPMLLDTCATIWIANGTRLAAPLVDTVDAAARAGRLYVSPVSAWEIGLLANPGGRRQPIIFHPDPKTWFMRLISRFSINRANLTEEIALDSAILPGDFHRDPADRLLAATARAINATLLTSDHRILDYAKQGHIRAIAC